MTCPDRHCPPALNTWSNLVREQLGAWRIFAVEFASPAWSSDIRVGAYVRLLATTVAWAGSAIAVKTAVVTVPPITLSFLRYALAAVLFSGMLVSRGAGIPRRVDTWLLALAGLLGIVGWSVGYSAGLSLTGAAEGTIVSAASPIATGLIAAVVLGDKLSRRWLVGATASFAGIGLLIVGGPGLASVTSIGAPAEHVIGDLFVLGSAVAWAGYTVLVRVLQRRGIGLLETSGYSTVAGAFLLAPAVFLETGRPEVGEVPLTAWLSVVYLGTISTVGAYLWWNEGTRRIGAARASVFTNLTTVNSVILATILLGERLTLVQIAGGVVVLLGLAAAQRTSDPLPDTSNDPVSGR